MRGKFWTVEFTATNLALDHHCWTFSLDMLEKLSSCHMLVLFLIANVTAEFGTLIHRMFLKIKHGLPDDAAAFLLQIAFMWKFTEINAVSQNFVNVLHKVSANLTIGTAQVELRSHCITRSSVCGTLSFVVHLSLIFFLLSWRHFR